MDHTRRSGLAVTVALAGIAGAAAWIAVDPPRQETVAPAGLPAQFVAAGEPLTLRFAAFSSVREAFTSRVLPAFRAKWNHNRRHDVQFVPSYDGSTALTQAIGSDLEADVALLSSSEDMQRMVDAGLVAPDWQETPYNGIVCRSLIALAVRKGNPRHISGWAELTLPGLQIELPDPGTSGLGRWAVAAIYGAAWRGHAGVPAGDHDAALAFVARVLANVVPERARNAADSYRAFLSGPADVAITYESSIGQSWLFGHEVERVIPDSTLLVESPVAVITAHAARHELREVAAEFVSFLWSRRVQEQLAYCWIRPVDAAVMARNASMFPTPPDLWTIDDLGGWPAVRARILAPAGFGGSAAGLNR